MDEYRTRGIRALNVNIDPAEGWIDGVRGERFDEMTIFKFIRSNELLLTSPPPVSEPQVCLIAILSTTIHIPNSSSIHNAVHSYPEPSQPPTTTPTTKFDTNGIRASEGQQPAQHPKTWRTSTRHEPGSTTTTNTPAGSYGK